MVKRNENWESKQSILKADIILKFRILDFNAS